MRARRSEWRAALLMLAFAAAPARGQVPSALVLDRVLGVRMDASRALLRGDARASRVEFSDLELFGVPGLRLSGARVSLAVHGLPVAVDLTRLGAVVGSHTRATLCAGVETTRWRVSLRGGIESLALAGTAGESSLVTAIVSAVDVGGATLLADVESIGGASGRATFLCAAVAGPLSARARVVASMRYDGPGALAVGAAAVVPLHRSLALVAGYDDGSETARVAAVIGAGRLSVATGAFRHAVLGLSQGASFAVTW